MLIRSVGRSENLELIAEESIGKNCKSIFALCKNYINLVIDASEDKETCVWQVSGEKH